MPVGIGHSSPVVGTGRVFVHSREGEDEVVRCLRMVDGSEVWRKAYPAPYEMNPAARPHGKGPKSTPALTSDRLVTLGINGILSCWDADSGALVWRKEFGGEFPNTSPLYGTAASPLIDGDRCIAFIGGHNGGALRSFNLADGSTVWSWDGDGPGYSTPVIAQIGDVRQLIVLSQQYFVGVSAEDGELLWRIPFETRFDQNIVTPVMHGDEVIISGHRAKTMALRLRKSSAGWTPEVLWEKARPTLYMSSPVRVGNWLFGFAEQESGQFFCLDSRTGNVLWAGEGRQGKNALLFGAGSLISALTTEGKLVVFKAQPNQYDAVASYEVSESPTWAQPAFLDGGLLIKNESELIHWTY